MLVELAVGDAYGAGFEYVWNRKFVSAHNDLSAYVRHPWHKQKPGTYTDDTQMSIAIAELVVEGGDWSPLRLAEKFVEVFQRDPRRGYSKQFYAFLKKIKDGATFLANIRPASEKSGAAMRAAPIGVYASIEEVIEKSTVQASVTHDTPAGIHAAVAASLMAHYFLYGLGPKSELPVFLSEHVSGDWQTPWLGEVGSQGLMSVRAALTSVLKHDAMSAILKSCIAWMGDTDTVAAIAMAVASCCSEIERDLPEHLIKGLEKGTYGRAFLGELDGALMRGSKMVKG